MPVDGGQWCDMMGAMALYNDDDKARSLRGWQERWRRGGRAAVGGSIYMEDPYLPNLLTARPTRHCPEYLKSTAKAFLFPSLTLYSLATFHTTAHWGNLKEKRGMNVTRGNWSRGQISAEREVLKGGENWCRWIGGQTSVMALRSTSFCWDTPVPATPQWDNVCSSQAGISDGRHVIAPTGLAGHSSSMIANLPMRTPVAASRRTTEHVYLRTLAWWVRTKSFCAGSGAPAVSDGSATKRFQRGEGGEQTNALNRTQKNESTIVMGRMVQQSMECWLMWLQDA